MTGIDEVIVHGVDAARAKGSADSVRHIFGRKQRTLDDRRIQIPSGVIGLGSGSAAEIHLRAPFSLLIMSHGNVSAPGHDC